MSSHPWQPAGDRRRRRESARVAGRARGRQLRHNARGRARGHQRDQTLGLAVAYRVQQVDRARFAELFAELRGRQGILVSERGLETRWQLYQGIARTYRTKGQEFKTTNGQRARSMDLAGRRRSTRTVQRAHRDLALMGLVRVLHVKRGGWRAGRRDCLRVVLTPSFVTPPTAAPAAPLRGANAGAPCSESRQKVSALPDSIAPPDGGRDGPAPRAAPNGSDERESSDRSSRLEPDGSPSTLAPQLQPLRDAARRAAQRRRGRSPDVLPPSGDDP